MNRPSTLSLLALSTITAVLSACGTTPTPQVQAGAPALKATSLAAEEPCLQVVQTITEASGCTPDPGLPPIEEPDVRLPIKARYWVAIDDQNANPWNGTGTAMTWTTIGTASDAAGTYLRLGADASTNVYSGDTNTSAALAVACLKSNGLPRPTVLPPTYETSGGATRSGWTVSDLNFTPAVVGNTLTSRAVADQLCAKTFGAGYRMAEFHDGKAADEGWAGWDFWARQAPKAPRYWVAIDDQNANPWNGTGRAMTWTVLDQKIGGPFFKLTKYLKVGSDAQTDPYNGDTDTTSSLPLICLIKTGSPRPDILPPTYLTPGGATRGGWSQGYIQFTKLVQGNTLASRADADALCTNTFGDGYRMAEFHDGKAAGEGWAGWDFWAQAGR
jgi:hypothetical protein